VLASGILTLTPCKHHEIIMNFIGLEHAEMAFGNKLEAEVHVGFP
jgi:hypothetical protein